MSLSTGLDCLADVTGQLRAVRGRLANDAARLYPTPAEPEGSAVESPPTLCDRLVYLVGALREVLVSIEDSTTRIEEGLGPYPTPPTLDEACERGEVSSRRGSGAGATLTNQRRL